MNKTKISAAEKQEQTAVTDYLTDFLRSSARKMLQLAVTQEVEDFIEEHQVSSDKAEIVRNGYIVPDRKVLILKEEYNFSQYLYKFICNIL